MKQFLILITAIFALSLAACGSSSTPPVPPPGDCVPGVGDPSGCE